MGAGHYIKWMLVGFFLAIALLCVLVIAVNLPTPVITLNFASKESGFAGNTNSDKKEIASVQDYYKNAKPVATVPQPEAATANPIVEQKLVNPKIVSKNPIKNVKRNKAVMPVSEDGEVDMEATLPAATTVRVKQVAKKQEPRMVTAAPAPVKVGRQFTISEQQEFLRQYSDKNATISFIGFGTPDAEMNGLKDQIIQILQGFGYKNIERNWRFISEFTPPTEVHFGSTGRNAVSFYVPRAE